MFEVIHLARKELLDNLAITVKDKGVSTLREAVSLRCCRPECHAVLVVNLNIAQSEGTGRNGVQGKNLLKGITNLVVAVVLVSFSVHNLNHKGIRGIVRYDTVQISATKVLEKVLPDYIRQNDIVAIDRAPFFSAAIF
jgi:hypothetical protein